MLCDRKHDLYIDRLKREPYFEMDHPHFHPYYDIYYLRSGQRKFFLNDSIYTMEKGDLLFINRGMLHRATYRSGGTHERYALNFSDNYVQTLFEQFPKESILQCFANPFMTIPVNRRPYLEDLFYKIMIESTQTDPYASYLRKNYLEELLLFLVRYQKFFEAAKKHPEMNDNNIHETVKYIRQNFKQDITLAQAAAYTHMSATYFSKKFKLVTGFGFKEYLSNIRIAEASRLLLDTSDSITEIALSCGFNDSNYFGDLFKKTKGISPSLYRKNKELV